MWTAIGDQLDEIGACRQSAQIELAVALRPALHTFFPHQASGLVEVGAHTHTHAILSRLSPREQRSEIERSLQIVGEITGRPCQGFAYPNGLASDYDGETIRLLRAAGVRFAVTAMPGANDAATPALELRRHGVGPDLRPTDFEQLFR